MRLAPTLSEGFSILRALRTCTGTKNGTPQLAAERGEGRE